VLRHLRGAGIIGPWHPIGNGRQVGLSPTRCYENLSEPAGREGQREGTELVNVVIIGTGFGRYGMAPVYANLGFDVELVSPREPVAIERALASRVDLVSVHSPPFMHRGHVMTAIERGYAVLCDKPFGCNSAEARELRNRAREAGVLHFLNCEFRFNPARVRMKELIEEGAIGAVEHVSTTFFANGLRGRNHAWLNDKDLGGGWVGAWGSHALDTLRWLLDSEVVDCGGVSRIETPMRPDGAGGQRPSTAEDAFTAWFLMQNGCTASIDSGFSASVPMPQRLIVMGSDGALELVSEAALILRRAPAEDPSIPREERIRRAVAEAEGELILQLPPPPGDPHERSLTPWLGRVKEALAEGRQILPSFDDGVAVAEVMEKLKASLIPGGRRHETEVEQ
jgi:predicted dehydrogenase